MQLSRPITENEYRYVKKSKIAALMVLTPVFIFTGVLMLSMLYFSTKLLFIVEEERFLAIFLFLVILGSIIFLMIFAFKNINLRMPERKFVVPIRGKYGIYTTRREMAIKYYTINETLITLPDHWKKKITPGEIIFGEIHAEVSSSANEFSCSTRSHALLSLNGKYFIDEEVEKGLLWEKSNFLNFSFVLLFLFSSVTMLLIELSKRNPLGNLRFLVEQFVFDKDFLSGYKTEILLVVSIILFIFFLIKLILYRLLNIFIIWKIQRSA
ncbi:MAG: hypothetical protein GY754_34830 [bacterium]|nr:hypothetical protein [bacterium]